jgi:hypothetical protein
VTRRKASSLIEIRTGDGLLVTIENPPEELLRQILAVIGSHARPDTAKARRPRLVAEAGDASNPL